MRVKFEDAIGTPSVAGGRVLIATLRMSPPFGAPESTPISSSASSSGA